MRSSLVTMVFIGIIVAGCRKEVPKMEVEVTGMPELHVACVRHVGPYESGGIGEAFSKLMEWAGPKGYCKSGRVIGMYWDNPDVTPPEKCRSDACITVPEDAKVSGEIKLQTIPGGLYAVYHCEVYNNEFGKPWSDIMYEWLPGSGYEMDERPRYEIYLNKGDEDPEGKWILDICVPVKIK